MVNGNSSRSARYGQTQVDTASIREFVDGYMARQDRWMREGLKGTALLLTAAAISRYGARRGRR